jgi:phosphate transport system substrate-binding protein
MLRWLISLLALVTAPSLQGTELAAPRYVLRPGLEGRVVMKGSDSMDPMVRLWITEFSKLQPGVRFEVTSHGSGTAPPALMSGEADLGHMSREMNAEEIAAFSAKKGHPPTRVIVAVDALGIFVHPSNPLKRVLMAQIDAIYSQKRLGGWELPLETWGHLGVRGEWKNRSIHIYGRDAKSGTRAFFQEQVLRKGEFAEGYREKDQWGVVESVAKDPNGIGYGPFNYAGSDVRMLPVVPSASSHGYAPTLPNIIAGRYPLTRRLTVYLDKAPGREVPPAHRAFLDFILSREGQQLVVDYGSVPLPNDLLGEQVRALDAAP